MGRGEYEDISGLREVVVGLVGLDDAADCVFRVGFRHDLVVTAIVYTEGGVSKPSAPC
jgi:hypothetical protein